MPRFLMWGFLGVIGFIVAFWAVTSFYSVVVSSSHAKNFSFTPPEDMDDSWERLFEYKFHPISSDLIKKTEDQYIYEDSGSKDERELKTVEKGKYEEIYQELYLKESSDERGFHRYSRDDLLGEDLDYPEQGTLDAELPSYWVDEEQEHILHLRTSQGEKSLEFEDEILSTYLIRAVDDRVLLSITTEEFDSFLYMLTMDWEVDHLLELSYTMLAIEDDSFIESELESFTDFYHDEIFDEFADLFPPVEGHESYLLYNDNELYDREEEEFIIFDQDLLSADGRHVYLGAGEYVDSTSKIDEDEEQRIQKLDDYLAGNDEYVAEFMLDYTAIEKALQLSTPGSDYQHVKYFNDELILYEISYKGNFVGQLGEIELLVDFSGDDLEFTILDMLEN